MQNILVLLVKSSRDNDHTQAGVANGLLKPCCRHSSSSELLRRVVADYC